MRNASLQPWASLQGNVAEANAALGVGYSTSTPKTPMAMVEFGVAAAAAYELYPKLCASIVACDLERVRRCLADAESAAAGTGSFDAATIVRQLLGQTDRHGSTPLLLAARLGAGKAADKELSRTAAAIVQLLLRHHASCSVRNTYGRTPVSEALAEGAVAAALTLLKWEAPKGPPYEVVMPDVLQC